MIASFDYTGCTVFVAGAPAASTSASPGPSPPPAPGSGSRAAAGRRSTPPCGPRRRRPRLRLRRARPAAVAAASTPSLPTAGPIDVLVSGAAGNFPALREGSPPNGFKAVVDIDLLGTFHVMRAAYPHMRRPGGSLINISAPQASIPMPMQVHVCAAKAGVDMVTRCLAIEWGPEGLRVNGVVPGPIDGTEGMARLAPTDASAPPSPAACRSAASARPRTWRRPASGSARTPPPTSPAPSSSPTAAGPSAAPRSADPTPSRRSTRCPTLPRTQLETHEVTNQPGDFAGATSTPPTPRCARRCGARPATGSTRR